MTDRDKGLRPNQPGQPDHPDELDQLFAAARARKAQTGAAPKVPLGTSVETPSDALMARVLADALAHQPVAPAPQAPWQSLRDALGGWFGVGGLAAAGVAGLAIGISEPAASLSEWALWTSGAASELSLDAGAPFDVSELFPEEAQ